MTLRPCDDVRYWIRLLLPGFGDKVKSRRMSPRIRSTTIIFRVLEAHTLAASLGCCFGKRKGCFGVYSSRRESRCRTGVSLGFPASGFRATWTGQHSWMGRRRILDWCLFGFVPGVCGRCTGRSVLLASCELIDCWHCRRGFVAIWDSLGKAALPMVRKG